MKIFYVPGINERIISEYIKKRSHTKNIKVLCDPVGSYGDQSIDSNENEISLTAVSTTDRHFVKIFICVQYLSLYIYKWNGIVKFMDNL